MHELLQRNLNVFWGGLAAQALSDRGVRRAVISPGSRSTPMALGFALLPGFEAIPVLDERSAAFFALGIAKAQGEAVALLCTSGTAAANYLPAVVEAHYSQTPLVILTADRPAELRDCGAGQAIDQVKLFGPYVRYFHEVALPDKNLYRYLRQTLSHAVGRATETDCPGPVHLNVPFREPLAPVHDENFSPPGQGEIRPLSHLVSATSAKSLRRASLDFTELKARRGVIIGGRMSPGAWAGLAFEAGAGDVERSPAEAVQRLSEQLDWPLFADFLSPLRHTSEAGSIGCYDALLRSDIFGGEAPEAAIIFGELPTSKVLRNWLGQRDPTIIWLGAGPASLDPTHSRSQRLPSLPRPGDECPPEGKQLRRWREAAENYETHLDRELTEAPDLFEGAWPRLLARSLPPQTALFVASSMPVRDAEWFWPATGKQFSPLANRGANGIDGGISTAMGLAHAGGTPTAAVMGDLAFFHDQNGLLLAPELQGSLSIFVLNNEGGGIFENLPIADCTSVFERFFATPQQASIAAIAAAHGLAHFQPDSAAALQEIAANPPENGVRIVEIITDRKRDTPLRRSLLNAYAEGRC